MDLHSTYWYHESKRTRQKSMNYLSAYERHLHKFRHKQPIMFEIGCGYPSEHQPEGANEMGGSMEMFASWLGNGTRVVGIDILPECKKFADASKGVSIEIGSQNDKDFLLGLVEKYGEPDIILDDGNHIDESIELTFEVLFPHLKTHGVYIVEDIGGNHLGGSFPKAFDSENRFISKAFNKVLELNQTYAKNRHPDKFKLNIDQEDYSATSFGFMISNISFYRNLIVFEKDLNVPFDQMVAPPHYSF